MGRKPSKPGAIPRFRPRKQKSGKVCYYYDHGIGPDGKRREEPLGSDYGLAIQRWAEIEREANPPQQAVLMFAWVADRYMAEVAPAKAPRTFADNRREVVNLKTFFGDPPAPLDAIQPVNVRQYLTWRSKAPVRANREKALLSSIWNFARAKGYTALPNPCAGINGYSETGRDVYVEDDQFRAIWQHADACLRDAMDLAYLTGQRPADVLALTDMDARDGALHVRQAKTKAKLRIEIMGELAGVLERIRSRKRGYKIHCTRLVVNEHGWAIGVNAMSRRWGKACAAANITGLQFRDLRAKAGTDKADRTGDARQAQRQLGHASIVMTEHYLRNRKGQKVTPTR